MRPTSRKYLFLLIKKNTHTLSHTRPVSMDAVETFFPGRKKKKQHRKLEIPHFIQVFCSPHRLPYLGSIVSTSGSPAGYPSGAADNAGDTSVGMATFAGTTGTSGTDSTCTQQKTGEEIRRSTHQLREVGSLTSHYLQGFSTIQTVVGWDSFHQQYISQ